MFSHIDIDNILNKGIKSFGKEFIISMINRVYNNYNLPFISIGSGIGEIEYLANIQFYNKYKQNIEWIFIEKYEHINCLSSSKYCINDLLINVDYLMVDNLIKNNQSIIENCILFLNWCDSNQSNYDYEAIIKLKPKAILSIYEVFEDNYGAAGGKEFYEWTIDNSNDYHLKEMYKLVPSDNSYNDYVMDIRIGLWQHDSIFDDDDTIITYLESKIEHENNCSIM